MMDSKYQEQDTCAQSDQAHQQIKDPPDQNMCNKYVAMQNIVPSFRFDLENKFKAVGIAGLSKNDDIL